MLYLHVVTLKFRCVFSWRSVTLFWEIRLSYLKRIDGTWYISYPFYSTLELCLSAFWKKYAGTLVKYAVTPTETVLLLYPILWKSKPWYSSRRGATKKLLLKVEGQVKYCGLVAAISQVREPWLSHAWLTFRKKKIATVYIELQNEGKDWCSKAYYLLLLGTLGLEQQ